MRLRKEECNLDQTRQFIMRMLTGRQFLGIDGLKKAPTEISQSLYDARV